ncbi:adenylate cyclase [Sinobacterium caligoides]|uniref:Adenylate cyclase n=1 Tax=Sinobacterium caligoides TaxID=933926 RepID=A0A3N2DDY4_9GAMM|nr:CYTH domain-containing protein [Sinobacterium caligoides]ROR97986.1 adenylate cyclase [Sinobacterium caligoides]
MAREIERKYLVNSSCFKDLASSSQRIVQGYLSRVKERTVRVRIKGERGFLTIKGESDAAGLSRYEWERELPLLEAEELLKLCEPGVIEKRRYLVSYREQVFEVDEFYGDNRGLVVAELELEDEQQQVHKPQWLGREVTGEVQYYNARLIEAPYCRW